MSFHPHPSAQQRCKQALRQWFARHPAFWLWAFVAAVAVLLLWFFWISSPHEWAWLVKRMLRALLGALL